MNMYEVINGTLFIAEDTCKESGLYFGLFLGLMTFVIGILVGRMIYRKKEKMK